MILWLLFICSVYLHLLNKKVAYIYFLEYVGTIYSKYQ